MASQKLDNYLRAYRKRAGLSQHEVAFLLGCQDGAKISRYERHARRPSLENAWGYGIIFGARAEELFGGAVQKVARQIIKRAEILVRKLESPNPVPLTALKLQTLQAISSGPEPRPLRKP